jgi:hypothetical protein
MNKLLSFLMLVSLAFIYSCGSDDDGAPAITNTATIGGQAFTPTTSTATSITGGLNINLTDGTKEISITLDDKVSGTYSITTTVPSGRTQALTGSGYYSDGTKIYFAASGQVIVTVGTDGKASGTFILSGKASDGTTIELKDGKFTGLTVGSPPTSKCLISKITEDEGGSDVFNYDGDGRLIGYSSSGTDYSSKNSFYYASGLLTTMVETGGSGGQTKTYTTTYSYNSSKQLTKIVSKSGSTIDYEQSAEYNSAGQPIKITNTEYDGATKYSSVENWTWDSNGNVTKVVRTATYSGITETETNTYTYDNNSNYYKLFTNASGQSNWAFYLEAEFFSKNNISKITSVDSDGTTSSLTYTYIYNAKGYPTKITTVDTYNGVSDSYFETLEYIGCN